MYRVLHFFYLSFLCVFFAEQQIASWGPLTLQMDLYAYLGLPGITEDVQRQAMWHDAPLTQALAGAEIIHLLDHALHPKISEHQ